MSLVAPSVLDHAPDLNEAVRRARYDRIAHDVKAADGSRIARERAQALTSLAPYFDRLVG